MSAHRGVALFVSGVALTTVVVGCGDSKPAVCSDIDALKSTAQSLRDVQLQAGALTEIRDKLTALGTQFQTFKKDAKDEYADEVTKVQSKLDVLSTSATTAKQTPSLVNLSVVRTAAKDVAEAVKSLGSSVSGTCRAGRD